MRRFAPLPSLLAVLALGGCGTLGHGTRQNVEVTSQPVGAEVYTQGRLLGRTPTALNLDRRGDHWLTLRLAGHRDVTVRLIPRLDEEASLVDAIMGWQFGLLGLLATRPTYRLSPANVLVVMEPDSAQTTAPAGSDGPRLLGAPVQEGE